MTTYIEIAPPAPNITATLSCNNERGLICHSLVINKELESLNDTRSQIFSHSMTVSSNSEI